MHKLISDYLGAKEKEANAKTERMLIEELIIQGVDNNNLEGTKSEKVGNMKVTVTNKLTRTLDYESYKQYHDGLPPGTQFVELKPTINIKKLRILEAIDPTIVSACVTTKPAKPSLSIKETK